MTTLALAETRLKHFLALTKPRVVSLIVFCAVIGMMLDAGVYFAPSAFEAGFVSAAHSADDIAMTIALAARAFLRCG